MTNRIIKFRAWDIATKKFEGVIPRIHVSMPSGAFTIQDGEYLFSQFTGLHDKNGKEIYEGDVVMYVGMDGKLVGGRVMEVCYPDCFDGEADGSLYVPENWEVIGNVYESPELLNQ